MPLPSEKRVVPPEAGYIGLPVNDSPADIRQGFAYYNDEIRPRREFVLSDDGETYEWVKLEFGKPGGSLYPIWSSTPHDLRHFGLGVAMYFQTLQLLMVTFLVCALFLIQAQRYYSGPEYSDGQVGVPMMLKGSAVCTRHDIVCLDKQCLEVGTANLCHIRTLQAYLDLSMTGLFLVLIAIVSMVQNHVSARLDESMQTGADYSVLVDDPDPHDMDCDMWRDFFGQFGHVTFVTVAKNNGPLMAALAQRRAIMREIFMVIGNGNMPDDNTEVGEDGIAARTWDGHTFTEKIRAQIDKESQPAENGMEKVRRMIACTGFFGMQPMKKWIDALAKANEGVQKALDAVGDGGYEASKVFVTFETEFAQRRCLKALSQGTLTAAFDMGKSRIKEEHMFKGTNVLAIKQASEPAQIFWKDVDITFMKRVKQQGFCWLVTFFIVCGSVVICKQLQVGTGSGGAALWISLTNIIIPIIIRGLCFSVEKHVSLNDQQLSLFLKLTFFRWMNTAIVLYFITDFDAFLTADAMEQVQAVLFADALTTPLLRTLNPMDLINQLIVSNYAPTQEKMNSYFLGTIWYPAERYSDMTKTLFLALFYSCLFPSGLFLTCTGYAFIYTVDKYSLLRSWRTPSELGDEITKVSRGHMVFAVYCHAVMTMIFFSEFPFDNICQPKHPSTIDWHKFREVQSLYNVTTDVVHERCDQTVLGRLYTIFTERNLSRDNMYGKQRTIVRMYVYLVLGMSVVFFFLFFSVGIVCGCYHLFYGSYKSATDAQAEHFTTVEGIQAYIPFVTHPSLAYPLVGAKMGTFENKYLNFEMADDDLYARQSLFNKNELPWLDDDALQALFSEVKYYPPPADLVDGPEDMSASYKAVPNDEV